MVLCGACIEPRPADADDRSRNLEKELADDEKEMLDDVSNTAAQRQIQSARQKHWGKSKTPEHNAAPTPDMAPKLGASQKWLGSGDFACARIKIIVELDSSDSRSQDIQFTVYAHQTVIPRSHNHNAETLTPRCRYWT